MKPKSDAPHDQPLSSQPGDIKRGTDMDEPTPQQLLENHNLPANHWRKRKFKRSSMPS